MHNRQKKKQEQTNMKGFTRKNNFQTNISYVVRSTKKGDAIQNLQLQQTGNEQLNRVE